jgi:ribosomal protein S18 acetylase RimI-like enzyme
MRVPRRTAEFGIGVLEAWRGSGIGSALIERAEAWARSEGLDMLVLDVAAENEAARSLYLRLGYAPRSDHLAKSLR